MRTNTATVFDDAGKPIRVIVTARDVTEHQEAEDRLKWLANHDYATGLLNRRAFHAELDVAVDRGAKKGSALAILLIDLDNFKYINDTLGHQAGDEALAELAIRISKTVPSGGSVARLGGDEFAILLPDSSRSKASAVADQIFEVLHRPYEARGRPIELRASIGISLFPEHGKDSAELIKAADIALYAAKGAGRGTLKCFEPALRAEMQRQISMLSQARLALERKWVRAYFQPKVALASEKIVGFEALLRWQHPKAGLQLPESIIAAFEDTELALGAGEAMARLTAAHMARWIARGLQFGRVAINASAAEFRVSGYTKRLLGILAEHEVSPSHIEIEITENVLISDKADVVLTELKQLREAGVTVTLDDFGTGYSSLSHLRMFPVDAIKIDRSFIRSLATNPEDRAIVSAMVRLADSLSIEVVAEGIETEGQAEFLRSIGCRLGQGFFFGKPIAPAQVPSRLTRKSGTTRTWAIEVAKPPDALVLTARTAAKSRSI